MRIRTVGLLLFSLLFFLSSMILAGDYQKIFSIEDPVGDDYGPGTYYYPTDDVFKTAKGLFDITSFSISESEEDYLLVFEFSKLTDSWQSKFGFSLPFIEIYIDNQKGGSTGLFRSGSNVRLDSRHPWDLLITLSGWWVRAYKPDAREKEADFWNTDENPWDVKNATVEVEDNRILLYLNKEVTGQLKGSYLYLLVGGFDPFGPGYYRNISNQYSRWSFADPEHEDLGYAPRVIDIILPEGKEQKSVLADFGEDYPLVYPVRITCTKGLFPYLKLLIPIIFLLILLVFIMYKKPLVSHNNK
jgi:carbohydrate-binding DOMON domain-containing protein